MLDRLFVGKYCLFIILSYLPHIFLLSIKIIFFFRPRFIRDEINITDHLFFAIVDRSTNAPKNFLKYHNLTTSQLTKKFVVFQQQMPNNRVAKESSNNAAAVAAASPPYSVTLEDLSLATILRHIIDNYSNYIFYYIIDSSALVNGVELSELIEKLYFKSDFLIGHPIQECEYIIRG